MPAQAVFRPGVPEWVVRAAIFLALLPSYVLLALYGATAADAAGYYGIEPSDVQFSILLFYAGLVAYFPLDARLGAVLPLRHHFALCLGLLTLVTGLCMLTRQPLLLYGLRFGQGVLGAALSAACLTLIFSRLHSARARAMGYTVFYGALLGATPLSAVLATFTLETFNFPLLFGVLGLGQLGSGLFLLLLLGKGRLRPRLPMGHPDWPSLLYYASGLVLAAYLLVYGQQNYWLSSPRLRLVLAALLAAALLFGWRQRHLQQPFIGLGAFRYRSFRQGLALFGLFYLCRGTLGLCIGYCQHTLGLDARQLLPLQLANLAGLALSMAVVVRFLLRGASMRGIWLLGFGLLLAYHVRLYFLFGPGQQPTDFVLPLLVQGLGTGTLMVPLVVFTLSDLPPALGGAGSHLALATRFATYAGSGALIGYCQLAWRSTHFDHLRQLLLSDNPVLAARLLSTQQRLLQQGLAAEPARRAALRLLASAASEQSQLRFLMGYHALVGLGIAVLLLALLVLPPVQQQLRSFRARPE